jgi:hypothetical protein
MPNTFTIYLPDELMPVISAIQSAHSLPSRSAVFQHLLAAVAPTYGCAVSAKALQEPSPELDRRDYIDLRRIPIDYKREFKAWLKGEISRPSIAALQAAAHTHPIALLEQAFGKIPEPSDPVAQRTLRLSRFARLCHINEVRFWCCDPSVPIRPEFYDQIRAEATPEELEALGVPAA